MTKSKIKQHSSSSPSPSRRLSSSDSNRNVSFSSSSSARGMSTRSSSKISNKADRNNPFHDEENLPPSPRRHRSGNIPKDKNDAWSVPKSDDRGHSSRGSMPPQSQFMSVEGTIDTSGKDAMISPTSRVEKNPFDPPRTILEYSPPKTKGDRISGHRGTDTDSSSSATTQRRSNKRPAASYDDVIAQSSPEGSNLPLHLSNHTPVSRGSSGNASTPSRYRSQTNSSQSQKRGSRGGDRNMGGDRDTDTDRDTDGGLHNSDMNTGEVEGDDAVFPSPPLKKRAYYGHGTSRGGIDRDRDDLQRANSQHGGGGGGGVSNNPNIPYNYDPNQQQRPSHQPQQHPHGPPPPPQLHPHGPPPPGWGNAAYGGSPLPHHPYAFYPYPGPPQGYPYPPQPGQPPYGQYPHPGYWGMPPVHPSPGGPIPRNQQNQSPMGGNAGYYGQQSSQRGSGSNNNSNDNSSNRHSLAQNYKLTPQDPCANDMSNQRSPSPSPQSQSTPLSETPSQQHLIQRQPSEPNNISFSLSRDKSSDSADVRFLNLSPTSPYRSPSRDNFSHTDRSKDESGGNVSLRNHPMSSRTTPLYNLSPNPMLMMTGSSGGPEMSPGDDLDMTSFSPKHFAMHLGDGDGMAMDGFFEAESGLDEDGGNGGGMHHMEGSHPGASVVNRHSNIETPTVFRKRSSNVSRKDGEHRNERGTVGGSRDNPDLDRHTPRQPFRERHSQMYTPGSPILDFMNSNLSPLVKTHTGSGVNSLRNTPLVPSSKYLASPKEKTSDDNYFLSSIMDPPDPDSKHTFSPNLRPSVHSEERRSSRSYPPHKTHSTRPSMPQKRPVKAPSSSRNYPNQSGGSLSSSNTNMSSANTNMSSAGFKPQMEMMMMEQQDSRRSMSEINVGLHSSSSTNSGYYKESTGSGRLRGGPNSQSQHYPPHHRAPQGMTPQSNMPPYSHHRQQHPLPPMKGRYMPPPSGHPKQSAPPSSNMMRQPGGPGSLGLYTPQPTNSAISQQHSLSVQPQWSHSPHVPTTPIGSRTGGEHARMQPPNSGMRGRGGGQHHRSSTPISNKDGSPSSVSSEGKRNPCNCKKSRCLKLYCECFANEIYCDGCNCNDCQNIAAYEIKRVEAIKATKAKNPNAFKQKIHKGSIATTAVGPNPSSHNMGCRCKKSACLKKILRVF
uniref:CRC domain-containing protein n=1 Tax=Corethron hystrix TaxID=216773 RepID=A0A7S1FPP5_9STRA|mmetsp:Transcript_21157/g.48013  ORF Transcript_21157/g.48013 Transcript_21157/m.48013 type:complete len:1160 (+) Transcript_21157:722-4201(+)